nr:Fn3-like domain-containing protein [Tessaracoccus coleopterorum]
MTNTANQIGFSLAPGTPYLEPVFRQGGGLIDIPQAITSKTSVSPQKISLGEGEAGPVTTTLTVTNTSDRPVTYAIGARHGIATYGPASDEFDFYTVKADVRVSATEVTVPAHGTAKVAVQIGEDFGVDGALYGGWITLKSADDELTVPFAGLSGDYQALTALQFAAMTFAEDGELFLADDFQEYSMVGEDLPYLAFFLSYPVSELYVDVYKANPDGSKGARVHSNFVNYATELDMGRTEGLVTLAWDGTFQGNNGGNGKLRRVADGDYILEARVLKALGDASNPAHWETWTGSPITISYGEGAATSTGNGPAPKPKGKG